MHMVCTIGSSRENEPNDIADIDRTKMPSKLHISRVRVRKVRFVGHDINSTNKITHPAPDPMISAAKAAVVLSTRHEFRLAVCEEHKDDGWTDMDEPGS
jgi:hypothetical protein